MALLAVLAVVPFLNGLGGGFTYDDKPIVRDNGRIESPSRAGEIFTTHYFGGSMATGTNYRPGILLSFALQRWVHGNRPFLFHAVNVALHAGVTLLLAAWLIGLRFPRGAVLAAAALFAVVPIHVEAVTSIVGRGETLAAFLALLAAVLWLRATEGERLATGAYAGCLGAFLLAVFVKESAVVLPGMVALGELFRDGRGDGLARKVRGALASRGLAFVGLFLPVAFLFLVRRAVLGGFLISGQASIFDLENPLVPMPAPLRMANALLLLGRYAGKTFWPAHLSADHSAYALPLVSAVFDARVSVALAGLAALFLAAVVLLRSRPLFAFGLLFFLGTLLPGSNVFFPIGTIYAERLAYLPSAGLLAAATALFVPTAFAVPRTGPLRWREALLLAVVAAATAATVSRNRVWRNDAALFADTVKNSPLSAKARYNWAYQLSRDKRTGEAREQLLEAVRIFPRHYEAWGFLGKIAWDQGKTDDAIACYRKSTEIFPAFENGRWGTAKTLQAAGRLGEAEAAFDTGVRLLPSSYPLAFHRALLLEETGQLERAEREWRRALILGSGSHEARIARARLLARLGRKDEAAREAHRVLAERPSDAPARKFLRGLYSSGDSTGS
jgi:tetratricopeptide (TPR) repeat protein